MRLKSGMSAKDQSADGAILQASLYMNIEGNLYGSTLYGGDPTFN